MRRMSLTIVAAMSVGFGIANTQSLSQSTSSRVACWIDCFQEPQVACPEWQFALPSES
jgi:hypothetical protein